jgi:hypothetical protein
MKKKCLFIITGDTFRFGPQRSPNRGNKESISTQYLSIKSHLDFSKTLQDKFNITADIFLNIYKLTDFYDRKILEWYGNKVKFVKWHPKRLKNEHALIYDTINQLRSFFPNWIYKFFNINKINLNNYKFIIFLKPEIYLKKYFIKKFTINNSKVIYAHLDSAYKFNNWNGYGFSAFTSSPDIPYVNHIITYCPKRFYDLLIKNKVWHWHNSSDLLLKYVKRKNIDFFVNTFHLCCTSLDWNPIYSLVNRKEKLKHISPNLKYNFLKNKIYEKSTMKEYKNILYKDTIRENLKEIPPYYSLIPKKFVFKIQ